VTVDRVDVKSVDVATDVKFLVFDLAIYCCPKEDTQFLEYCGKDFAFHSGTMVNNNAPATTPEECQQQCVSLSTCEYWDLGEGFCRLRSNAGAKGLEAHLGYAYGRKNCRFEGVPALAPAPSGTGNATSTENN